MTRFLLFRERSRCNLLDAVFFSRTADTSFFSQSAVKITPAARQMTHLRRNCQAVIIFIFWLNCLNKRKTSHVSVLRGKLNWSHPKYLSPSFIVISWVVKVRIPSVSSHIGHRKTLEGQKKKEEKAVIKASCVTLVISREHDDSICQRRLSVCTAWRHRRSRFQGASKVIAIRRLVLHVRPWSGSPAPALPVSLLPVTVVGEFVVAGKGD